MWTKQHAVRCFTGGSAFNSSMIISGMSYDILECHLVAK